MPPKLLARPAIPMDSSASSPTGPTGRLHGVDALRAFAVLSILLLHNVEHFDLYYRPEGSPAWLARLDQSVWDTLFFLFGGKAYAIFALLFGLTFSIQYSRQERLGRDFRPRFAWRMALLALFGVLNSVFYEGDILLIYAVLGLALLPVARLPRRWLLALSLLLLLQPPLWPALWHGWQQPDLTPPNPASWALFEEGMRRLSSPDLLAAWWGNLSSGRYTVLLWSMEVGRPAQTCALFYLGFLAGRQGWFHADAGARRRWTWVFLLAGLTLALTHSLLQHLPVWVSAPALRPTLQVMAESWFNLSVMALWVSGWMGLQTVPAVAHGAGWIAPLGRMSLTAYVSQSILGAALYHAWGLGWFRYTGASLCLLIGLAFAALQLAFSHYWMRRHAQGPLETLWHRATWWGYAKPGSGVALRSRIQVP